MTRNYKLVDVSHIVEDGMITYKGLPGPLITEHLSRAESRVHYATGTEFQIGRIEMVANTGTYLDSPFHRFADGSDLAALDLYSLANLEAVVVRCNHFQVRGIEPDSFQGLNVRDKAVLFHTGYDSYWRTENYFSGNHPFLTADAARSLVVGGAALVGIDSYNIDDTNTGERPVHSALLENNIPIVEHLCGLDHLPDSGFKFFAVPVKVKGFGTFPVRAFGLIPHSGLASSIS